MPYQVGDYLQCISEGKVSKYFTLGVIYKLIGKEDEDVFRIQTNIGGISIHKLKIPQLFKKVEI